MFVAKVCLPAWLPSPHQPFIMISLAPLMHFILDGGNQSVELVKENFETIKGRFASLVNIFSSKLSATNIDIIKFRSFIVNLFPPGKFIANMDTVTDIFNALTHNSLWNHSHYKTFEAIYKEFGGGDIELRRRLDSYKSELAGFKATTRIIEFIKNCSIADGIAESEESISQYKARYDKEYYTELTMKLNERISERSLAYIDEFWMSIADLFRIPPLAALLERVREGCTEITWLISTQAASQVESAINSFLMFQQAQVSKITLDDKILYATEKEKVL